MNHSPYLCLMRLTCRGFPRRQVFQPESSEARSLRLMACPRETQTPLWLETLQKLTPPVVSSGGSESPPQRQSGEYRM